MIDDEYLVGYPHQFFICAVVHRLVQGPVVVVAGGPEVFIEPTMCDPGILWSGHSQGKCLKTVCKCIQNTMFHMTHKLLILYTNSTLTWATSISSLKLVRQLLPGLEFLWRLFGLEEPSLKILHYIQWSC